MSMIKARLASFLASDLHTDYRIATARSGADALKKAHALRPDATTLDVFDGETQSLFHKSNSCREQLVNELDECFKPADGPNPRGNDDREFLIFYVAYEFAD